MTTVLPAQCFACTRLRPSSANGTPTVSTCDAYPDEIPFAIAAGGDHRRARGDERDGRTFKQADSDDARNAFSWWERVFTVSA